LAVNFCFFLNITTSHSELAAFRCRLLFGITTAENFALELSLCLCGTVGRRSLLQCPTRENRRDKHNNRWSDGTTWVAGLNSTNQRRSADDRRVWRYRPPVKIPRRIARHQAVAAAGGRHVDVTAANSSVLPVCRHATVHQTLHASAVLTTGLRQCTVPYTRHRYSLVVSVVPRSYRGVIKFKTRNKGLPQVPTTGKI